MSVTKMTDGNWADIVAVADKPLIVYYFVGWNYQCRDMMTIIDQLSEEYEDRIVFAAVDVDAENWLRSDLTEGVPNFRVFNEGEYIGDVKGVMAKEELVEEIKKIVSF